MVWACCSSDYLILEWTAIGSKRTGLLNDYTHVDKAYLTCRPI